MKNTTPREFLEGSNACDNGMDFALKYATMYDVYEALLRGDAGRHSFGWALWILHEQSIDVCLDSLFLWLLSAVKPYLPAELQSIDPASFSDPDGSFNEYEENMNLVRRHYRDRVFNHDSRRPYNTDELLSGLSICTWYTYLDGDLCASSEYAIRVLLLAYLKESGAGLAEGDPSECSTREAYMDENFDFPPAFQEMLLTHLREIPNPFEKEMKQ